MGTTHGFSPTGTIANKRGVDDNIDDNVSVSITFVNTPYYFCVGKIQLWRNIEHNKGDSDYVA